MCGEQGGGQGGLLRLCPQTATSCAIVLGQGCAYCPLSPNSRVSRCLIYVDPSSSKPQEDIKLHDKNIHCIVYSEQLECLITGGEDSTIQLYYLNQVVPTFNDMPLPTFFKVRHNKGVTPPHHCSSARLAPSTALSSCPPLSSAPPAWTFEPMFLLPVHTNTRSLCVCRTMRRG